MNMNTDVPVRSDSASDQPHRHHRPLVTIGIPTRNRAGTYLPIALGSALAQDYSALEIVVSDNGSTDETQRYVCSLENPRIRYFRQDPVLTPNSNFNFCLQQARGTYFLLLHDDDLIDEDFVSACVQAARDQPRVGVIRTGIRVIDGEGRVTAEHQNPVEGLALPALLRAWFHDKTAFYLPNTLYNTERLRELGGFRSRREMFQDVVALVRLAATHGTANVKEIKASFRHHEANMGFDPDKVMAWAEDCLELRDLLVDLVPPDEKGPIRAEASAYLSRKAYRRARLIGPWEERVKTYASIFAMFGYGHSPWDIRRRLSRRLRLMSSPHALK